MSDSGNALISVIQHISQINAPEQVVSLISRQLKSYGASGSDEAILGALENALREGSRAVLFCRYAQPGDPVAFAFGNVCSGLESGGDYLWLNELYVDDAWRRRGVAGELLDYIESWARTSRIGYIALTTGTTNSAALELYRKKGYDLDSGPWIDKALLQ